MNQLKKMMTGFERSTEKQGSKNDPDKTKIFAKEGSNEQREVDIDNM